MNRFNVEVLLLSMLAVAVTWLAAVHGEEFSWAFGVIAQSRSTYLALAVAVSCILGGVVGGLKRRLPNYGGRPPMASLLQHMQASLATLVLAALLGAGIGLLLKSTPVLSPGSLWALKAALGLNVVTVLACAIIAGRMMRDYRQKCAWEDAVHPHQRNC